MRKTSLLLVMILILALVISGCTKKDAGNGEKAADTKIYEVKISHLASLTDPIQKGFEKFKEIIEAKSNGRFKVTIYGNKQISGSDRENAEKVQNNIVQMGSVPTFTLAALGGINQYKVFDYPYLFKNDDDIYKVMDGPIGTELSQKLIEKTGIKGYGAYSLGWVKVASNKQPIKSPEDIKKLKIRTVKSDLYMALVDAWGANPTPVNYGEVFTALQQGVVDGMMTTTGLYVSDRFYEVQKYMATVNPVSIVHIPIVNNEFYESLPDDLKVIFDESIDEYLDAVRQYEAEGERNAIKQLREKGMDVVELNPEQLKTFSDPALSLMDEKADLVGKDFLDKVKAELAK